jgi:hypothetical protein
MQTELTADQAVVVHGMEEPQALEIPHLHPQAKVTMVA